VAVRPRGAVVEEVMHSGADLDRNDSRGQGLRVDDRVRSALVVVGGLSVMIGLAVALMSLLTSPDGWVMKAAKQAMLDQQQQAVATSYLLADH
jgi:hypothetical protein